MGKVRKAKYDEQSAKFTHDRVIHFYQLWFGLLQNTNDTYKLIPSMIGKEFLTILTSASIGKSLILFGNIHRYLRTGQYF